MASCVRECWLFGGNTLFRNSLSTDSGLKVQFRSSVPVHSLYSSVSFIPTSSLRSISRRSMFSSNHTESGCIISSTTSRCQAAEYSILPSGTPAPDDPSALHGLPLWRQTRLHVIAMVALALLLCNADRVIMSVAIVPLSAANGWSESIGGVVQVHVLACTLKSHRITSTE